MTWLLGGCLLKFNDYVVNIYVVLDRIKRYWKAILVFLGLTAIPLNVVPSCAATL
jgi:hypothetical protein